MGDGRADAEVRYFEQSLVGNDDVAGFQVAVHDASALEVLQAQTQLDYQVYDLFLVAQRPRQVLQSPVARELHQDVEPTLLAHARVAPHHVRVVQAALHQHHLVLQIRDLLSLLLSVKAQIDLL